MDYFIMINTSLYGFIFLSQLSQHPMHLSFTGYLNVYIIFTLKLLRKYQKREQQFLIVEQTKVIPL